MNLFPKDSSRLVPPTFLEFMCQIMIQSLSTYALLF